MHTHLNIPSTHAELDHATQVMDHYERQHRGTHPTDAMHRPMVAKVDLWMTHLETAMVPFGSHVVAHPVWISPDECWVGLWWVDAPLPLWQLREILDGENANLQQFDPATLILPWLAMAITPDRVIIYSLDSVIRIRQNTRRLTPTPTPPHHWTHIRDSYFTLGFVPWKQEDDDWLRPLDDLHELTQSMTQLLEDYARYDSSDHAYHVLNQSSYRPLHLGRVSLPRGLVAIAHATLMIGAVEGMLALWNVSWPWEASGVVTLGIWGIWFRFADLNTRLRLKK